MFKLIDPISVAGGRSLNTLTATEKAILNDTSVVEWVSAAAPDCGYSRLSLRGRVTGKLWKSQGQGAFGDDVNSVPTVGKETPSSPVNEARFLADFQMPLTYTVYGVVKVKDLSANRFILTSDSITDNRLYLYISSLGQLTIDHGTNGSAATGGVSDEDTVVFCICHDSAELETSIFKNSLTASVSLSSGITGPHKANAQTAMLGHTSQGGGLFLSDLIITDTPDHLTAYAAKRAAIIQYLADRSGVTLS